MTYSHTQIIHGVFMNIFGVGVLLTGDSGAGKSELALALILRGHQLIADDAPEFSCQADNTLLGRAPPALKNFLELRGLGLFNIRELIGSQAIKDEQSLALVIHLEPVAFITREITPPLITAKFIANISIPLLQLPYTPARERRLELLVEILVTYWQHSLFASSLPANCLRKSSSQLEMLT